MTKFIDRFPCTIHYIDNVLPVCFKFIIVDGFKLISSDHLFILQFLFRTERAELVLQKIYCPSSQSFQEQWLNSCPDRSSFVGDQFNSPLAFLLAMLWFFAKFETCICNEKCCRSFLIHKARKTFWFCMETGWTAVQTNLVLVVVTSTGPSVCKGLEMQFVFSSSSVLSLFCSWLFFALSARSNL